MIFSYFFYCGSKRPDAIISGMKTQNNNSGERVIAVSRPTLLSSIPAFLFVAVVSLAVSPASPTIAVLVAIAGFGIVGVLAFLGQIAAKYTFTSLRIKAQFGLLSIRTSEVRIADIRGVSVRKPLLGRILGYSSAAIGTAATAGAEIRVINVRGLDAILAEIDALRNQSESKSAATVAEPNESRIVYDSKSHQYVRT